jgi:hypothetical protein
MMKSETFMYRMGKLAAGQVLEGLDKNQETELLKAIYEDAQFLPQPDLVTPVTDFTVGYLDRIFQKPHKPSDTERNIHKDFFKKAKNMAILGLYQRPTSSSVSYEGPFDPSFD